MASSNSQIPTVVENIRYDTDFHAWLIEQATHLRAGRFEHVDAENIAEELDGLANKDRRELRSRLAVLLAHLLKWHYQPNYMFKNSWVCTINVQRHDIADLLSDSPSLRTHLDVLMVRAYQRAHMQASSETGLASETFPASCPWTVDQVLDEDYWP